MAIFVGCQKTSKQDTDDVDGGVRINTNFDAPKEIESTEIKSFYCEFSNLTMMNKDTFLKNRVYQMESYKAVIKFMAVTRAGKKLLKRKLIS